jgi:hypothetical protein
MKTTVEISDAVLNEARRVAQQEHTTLRELIEEGLRAAIEQRKCVRTAKFRLRDLSFGGNGLQPEFADATFREILDASYEGRGT